MRGDQRLCADPNWVLRCYSHSHPSEACFFLLPLLRHKDVEKFTTNVYVSFETAERPFPQEVT